MGQLSDDEYLLIKRLPLGPSVRDLQIPLQAATGDDDNDSQQTVAFSQDAEEDSKGDTEESGRSQKLTPEDKKDAILKLIIALLGHNVASKLRSPDTGGTVDGELGTLYGRLRSSDLDITLFSPLIHAVVQEESDVEIWKAVLQLIAAATRTTRTTPPPSNITSLPSSRTSLPGTPRLNSSASHEGADQTKALLADALRDEFYKRAYKDVPGFFEKYLDDKSWAQQCKDIYNAVKHEHVNGRWRTFPKHPTERLVWDWISQFQQKRLPDARCIYYTTKKSSDMTGIDADGQLDLLIKPRARHTSDLHDWADVRAAGEHTVSTTQEKFLQLARYARNTFKAQPRRRFMHGFTLRGTSMELYVFDRSGAYSAAAFDIHAKPERFIRVLAGYCLMSDDEFGMDTFTEREGIREFVTVKDETTGEDRRMELEPAPIATQSAVVCRGTCCYSTMDGKHVAKFSWVSADKWLTEPDLLATAHERNVRGVAQLVGRKRVADVAELREGLTFAKRRKFTSRQERAEALSKSQSFHAQSFSGQKRKSVHTQESFSAKRSRSSSQMSRLNQAHGVDDSVNESQTSLLPEGEAPFTNRVLSCLVVKPAGRPLDSFRSVSELLRAFRDAIKAHRSLFLDGKILHRDISQNNIIITDPAENGGFSGMLIDLDLATQVDKEGNNVRTNNPGMTGTLKFMAIEVVELALQGSQRDLAHTYRHDLESFFYVFLSICINCGWDAGKGPKEDRLRHWYVGSYKDIVRAKSGDMVRFEDLILPEFSPASQHLKGLAMELRDLLFLRSSKLQTGTPAGEPSVLYDKMIGAFDRSLEFITDK